MVEASVKMGFLFDPFLLSKLDLGFLIFWWSQIFDVSLEVYEISLNTPYSCEEY